MSRPVRLTLLTEIPAPYRIPIFNAVAERDDVELSVLFLRDRDPKRPHYAADPASFGFARRTVPGFHVVRGGRWLIVNAGVAGALIRSRPDVVVVGGWAQPAFWQALVVARLRRLPVVAWVESTSRDKRSGSLLLERAKRRFLLACAGFAVPGRASADYLRELGVPEERISIAPNAADVDLFGAPADRAALRSRLGISRTCVLCVARLDPEKAIDLAIRAVGRLPQDVELALAGTGTEERSLRALAQEVAPGRVRFLGFLQPSELADWYRAADAFVLPSRSEQWGIPLNEAAVAGLPLVATDAVGAAHDLIEDGVNGFRVPVGDEQELADALERLTSDEGFRAAAGRRSRELATRFTPDAWAAALARLARRLVG